MLSSLLSSIVGDGGEVCMYVLSSLLSSIVGDGGEVTAQLLPTWPPRQWGNVVTEDTVLIKRTCKTNTRRAPIFSSPSLPLPLSTSRLRVFLGEGTDDVIVLKIFSPLRAVPRAVEATGRLTFFHPRFSTSFYHEGVLKRLA